MSDESIPPFSSLARRPTKELQQLLQTHRQDTEEARYFRALLRMHLKNRGVRPQETEEGQTTPAPGASPAQRSRKASPMTIGELRAFLLAYPDNAQVKVLSIESYHDFLHPIVTVRQSRTDPSVALLEIHGDARENADE